MTKQQAGLHRMLEEMKRRHVFRVTGAYVIGLWLLLQVADVVFPALLLPTWTMTALVVTGIALVPLVAMMAWVYDITPEGVVRSDGVRVRFPAGGLAGRWLDWVIIAALLAILGVVLYRGGDTNRSERLAIESIAVLPFADLSPNRDSGYFGDGMAEAIMDSVARIPGLRVSARTSSFSFRDRNIDIPQVAALLGVDSLLEGSVRTADNRLRVTARLVDGVSGHNLWNETYEGNLEDVFAFQDQIARSIARVLQLRLAGEEDLAPVATLDPLAYDSYLRGRDRLRQDRTTESNDRAIAHFEQALARDPRFALAEAGLCRALWERYELTSITEHAETATRHCRMAETLSGTLPEIRIALGNLYLGTGQIDKSEAEFRQLLANEPNLAEAHYGLSRTLLERGLYDDALTSIQKAIDLDPAYWRYHWEHGAILIMTGQLDAGIEAFQQSIRLNPDTPDPYYSLGGAYYFKGEFLLAAEAFRQSIERHPNPVGYSNAGTYYFFAGDFAQAEAAFRMATELVPDDYRFAGFLAWAIRMQENRLDQAKVQHERVIEAVRARLDINPADMDARAARAMHLAALGREEAARDELQRLEASEHLGVNALASMGHALVLMGELSDAAEVFGRAIESGFPLFLLASDPRLEDARAHPAFVQLMGDPPPVESSVE